MGDVVGISDEELLTKYEELGSLQATARYFDVGRSGLQQRLRRLGVRPEAEVLEGLVQAKRPEKMALPEAGQVKRYLLTAAQANTKVNMPFFLNLVALADYYKAELLISRFTYNHKRYGKGSVKPGTEQSDADMDAFFDPAIEPYVCDERVELAPGLVFVGDMNVLPTASRPLSGLEGFTKRASGIFPHAKIAMDSVPSAADEPTKFNYTTGAVTRRNYIQKKAGQKAEFHHAYGALIVEVEADGSWWVRQLNADGANRIVDLDIVVDQQLVRPAPRAEALTPGDIHVSEIDRSNAKALWDEGGVLDFLRPKKQFLHDLFSMRSRSHHEMRSFHRMMDKHSRQQDDVWEEIRQTTYFTREVLCRPWLTNYVVRSNHDEHLDKWLDTVDYREDLVNAEFFLEAQLAAVKAIKAHDTGFNLLKWAMQKAGLKASDKVKFLDVDESLITCRSTGGIENGLHGDKGPNGARGSMPAFAKMARKLVIGHAHSAAIMDGVYRVGTSSKLRLPYTKGPSSWSHTHCITYFNGKRTLFTVWRGKAWADRSNLEPVS